MTLSALLLIALMGGSHGSPDLCSGVLNRIEPDMRILESDLTQAAAVEAAERLRGMVARGELAGEAHFGALNQAKVIYGHILLRQAQADRKQFGLDSAEAKDSVRALCRWLGTEGFWYD